VPLTFTLEKVKDQTPRQKACLGRMVRLLSDEVNVFGPIASSKKYSNWLSLPQVNKISLRFIFCFTAARNPGSLGCSDRAVPSNVQDAAI
jgi:hypothetical protein